uniref:Uncharacterized protein n=1 Tax=Mycena chlorophos TaxID=658473 RepID=A0ABQ0LNY5_MYCCL|nr:predicted protein [Mycena chlorophos]
MLVGGIRSALLISCRHWFSLTYSAKRSQRKAAQRHRNSTARLSLSRHLHLIATFRRERQANPHAPSQKRSSVRPFGTSPWTPFMPRRLVPPGHARYERIPSTIREISADKQLDWSRRQQYPYATAALWLWCYTEIHDPLHGFPPAPFHPRQQLLLEVREVEKAHRRRQLAAFPFVLDLVFELHPQIMELPHLHDHPLRVLCSAKSFPSQLHHPYPPSVIRRNTVCGCSCDSDLRRYTQRRRWCGRARLELATISPRAVHESPEEIDLGATAMPLPV